MNINEYRLKKIPLHFNILSKECSKPKTHYLCPCFNKGKMKSDAYKGHLAMLGANILWGLMSPVSKAVLMAGPVSALSLTTFRMVGAAVLLMAAVVAAPFVIDNEPPIDTSKLESTDISIPKESETSTTLNVPPAAHGDRAQAGDVDVSDTSMGRAESTAKANLEREAKGAAEAAPKQPGKTAAPAQAAKSEKVEKTPAKPAEKTAAKPDSKAQKPAQKPQPAAKSAGIAPPTGKGWYVQVVATSNEAAAERTVKKLAHLGLPAYRTNEGGALWKVRVGLYAEKSEAEGVRGTIMLNGIAQKPYLAKKD